MSNWSSAPVRASDSLDRAQAGEDAVDRLLADRHADRGAAAGHEVGRQLGQVGDGEAAALAHEVKKPNTAVQKPIEIQPKSAPKKMTMASSTQDCPWCGRHAQHEAAGDDRRQPDEDQEQDAAAAGLADPRQAAALLAELAMGDARRRAATAAGCGRGD